MVEKLTKLDMMKALRRFDEHLTQGVELLVGGGAAMVCVYDFPLHTTDIDVVLKNTSIDKIQPIVHQVAQELGLTEDWLNTWYSSFTYTLPEDFYKRIRPFFNGNYLLAHALGPEDLLVLKCCAHRIKDLGHARFLIRKNADYRFVMNHLEKLLEKNILLDEKPLEFLENVLEKESL